MNNLVSPILYTCLVVLAFLLTPVFVYMVVKMATVAFYNGRQFFESKLPNNQGDQTDVKKK